MLELAIALPLLAFLLLGAIEFGRLYYLAIEVSDAATAGAKYGITNAADKAGIVVAAQHDAPDIGTNLNVSSTAGFDVAPCSGAASAVPTPRVVVQTTYAVRSLFSSVSLTLHGCSDMRISNDFVPVS